MAKLELRGWFHEVLAPERLETKDGKSFEVQELVFIVPGYKDAFQQIDRPDEPWRMQVKGENIEKLNLSAANQGQRVKATVFIEGYAGVREEKQGKQTIKKPFFGYRVTLYSFEPYVKGQ